MFTSLGTIYLLGGILVSAATGIYAWRNDQTRGNRAFAAATMFAIPWMVGEVILRNADPMSVQWLGEILKYLGATFLPVSLLVFARHYCGRGPSWRSIRLLCVIPVVSWLMMMTNPWHYIFFATVQAGPDGRLLTGYGPFFWLVHTPYSYTLLTVCLYTIFAEFIRSSRRHRLLLLVLFFSFCLPVVVNVLGVLGLVGKITPYSFPVFFSVVAYAMFRLRFLGSNPIAYEAVFKTIRDGVLILDGRDVIHDINPAAATGLGKPPSAILGLHVRDAFEAWPAAIELYDTAPVALGSIEVEVFGSQRFLQIDSTPIVETSSRKTDGRIITIRDITDRHKHQLSLESLAFHDPLTRLANRRKFQEEVDRAIVQADEKDEPFAILYFDLNKFKAVNDTLGHEVGDELLKYVAARVASILRKPDLLSRLGGDEFAMLLHNCNEKGVELVIERLLDNVQRPFKVDENTLVADLSIGTAYYPQNGSNLTELLRHADAEMYRAKQAARDPFGFVPIEVLEISGQIAN
ncbi:MAG: diguanylate cyclase [Pyrinomonadaceae bacterium]